MIPYQLKIHGIRDYSSRSIDLGNPDEHILITGPNGVGKSTLTFCLGAVLNSAKVDVEGLRSNNLKSNEPWFARITLTFLNEGPTRVDGPKYIAFQLTVKQEVKNGPYQREFEVLNGSHEEELVSKDRYTSSGSVGRTIKDYTEDLQMRYKIHPDHFYLIWYQQEVNQFAAMSPLERFRKFSDMFGISNMQREWEASLAQIKDVQEEIERLKSTQKSAEIALNAARTALNQYLDNKKRIQESGQQYYTLLHKLIEKFEVEIASSEVKKAENQIEKEKLVVNQQQLKEEIVRLKNEKKNVSYEIEGLDFEVLTLSNHIEEQHTLNKDKQHQQKVLEKQLESISEKGKLLRFDEAVTTCKLQETQQFLNELTANKQRVVEDREYAKKGERELIDERAVLNSEAQRLKTTIEQAKNQVELYKSSAHIQQQISEIEQQNTNDFESIGRLRSEIKKLEDVMQQSKQKKFVSSRQQAGLKDLKKQGIEAYTLRELIELMPSVPVQLEKQFESIKYSIFYIGKNYKPINDLYYVSLSQLIPTESVSKVTELGLQIRNDLNEHMSNYANKALWWVKQFFIATPKIEQGILIDGRGVRGAQESEQLILSDAALEKLYLSQQQQLNSYSTDLKIVTDRYEGNISRLQDFFRLLTTLRSAESTLLRQTDYNEKLQQLEMIDSKIVSLIDEQNELDIIIDELNREFSVAKHDLAFYKEQLEIHEQLGAFAEQQLQLDEIKRERQNIQHQIRELSVQLDEKEITLKKTKRKISKLNETIEENESNLKIIESEMLSFDLSLKQLADNLESFDTRKVNYVIELQELENILPTEVKFVHELDLNNPSITYLISAMEPVKVTFIQARQEKVNENAQYNYDKQKTDFDKKNADLAEAEQLLESNRIRANTLEDKLETTINMYLAKINILFQKYMDLFQFEGIVEKERVEEKSGRIRFSLYIKARKIGHQGTLEDVSIKARSGKVGKGVSGGEESLSSLLFALSLLQNLSISPGYIVLDEFDSALDDERKNKVFKLYADELQRKLIIVSPKGHDEVYYNYFSKVFIIEHDAKIPRSRIRGIKNLNSSM